MLNGMVAYVSALPDCDFCKLVVKVATERGQVTDAEITKAKYDFRTNDGRWAMGCEAHYKRFRMHGELGIGKGQMLRVRPVVDA